MTKPFLAWDAATRRWVECSPPAEVLPPQTITVSAEPEVPTQLDFGIQRIRRLLAEAKEADSQKRRRSEAAAALAQAGRDRMTTRQTQEIR